MEFETVEGVVRSKTKNETLLLGRVITVMQKRKNLPKPKQHYSAPLNGANPFMMQACAMMMAACSAG